MVGITLSADQIHHAPPEVRNWLEQQIAGALGFCRPEPALPEPHRHLIGCSPEEARTILSVIQGLLPVVGIFFELGREPIAASPQGLRALRLDDMLRHSKLRASEQIVSCLEAIDKALQQVRGEPDVVLTALDRNGHCLVAEATARSITAVWQEIVAAHDPGRTQTGPAQAATQQTPAFRAPYAISVPAFSAPQQAGVATG